MINQRKPIVAANWKMNKTQSEASEFVSAYRKLAAGKGTVDVVIVPPFTALPQTVTALGSQDVIKVGAQNMHWKDSGAYTGEISAMMLRALPVDYVVIGHSERRQYFGETDETVNKKVKAAHKARLKPIVCVGESLEQRDADQVGEVLKRQIEGGLKDLTDRQIGETVVAYEPIWAIGTGRTASPEQAQEAHAFIRKTLSEIAAETANRIRIQYGGSVKPDNMAELISQEDVDGALVGGAALEAESFYGIVKAAAEYVETQK